MNSKPPIASSGCLRSQISSAILVTPHSSVPAPHAPRTRSYVRVYVCCYAPATGEYPTYAYVCAPTRRRLTTPRGWLRTILREGLGLTHGGSFQTPHAGLFATGEATAWPVIWIRRFTCGDRQSDGSAARARQKVAARTTRRAAREPRRARAVGKARVRPKRATRGRDPSDRGRSDAA